MATFDKYEARRSELAGKIQTLADFEKTDKTVGIVFALAREILLNPKAMRSPQWLVITGAKLAAYFGYLDGSSNQAWAEYKSAEIALREIRDALVTALKKDAGTITEAKAQAGSETSEAEVDVILREKKSRDYETAAKMCERMLSFVQSSLRALESERSHLKIAERGMPMDR